MTRPAATGRPLGRLLLLAAAAVIGAFVAPGTAQARPTLLFTTPAADAAEPASPSTVVLVFNEPVTVASNALVVLDAAGRQTPVEEITSGRHGRAVTGRIGQPLPVGVYSLRWRVTGADGDLVESSFRFAVGAPITGSTAGPAGGAGTSWPAAGLRWLLLAGLAVAPGGAAGARLTGPARAARPSLPRLPGWPLIAGGAAAAGLAVWLAADTGVGALTTSTPGRVLLVEGLTFAAAAALFASRMSRWAWLPLLAVPIAEGIRGHAGQAAPGWGALATGVHVAAAAVWVGALVHVVRAALGWRAVPAAVWRTVTGYARMAAWLFAAVVATGTVPRSSSFHPPRCSLRRTGGSWWSSSPGRGRSRDSADRQVVAAPRPDTLPRIARATRVEAAVLAGVLAATAALTATPPPRDSRAVADRDAVRSR